MLQLRPYQVDGVSLLRDGFKANRSQILYGPCGFGKSELAIYMMDLAQKKGTRCAFVVDRRVLCQQMSARLWKYGIDHGVIMAGSMSSRPDHKIQICTAQTLEKSGFPAVGLLIVDECHSHRESTANYIKNHPNVKVIGLSGSPFTKGLGRAYTNVESAITVRELVDQKYLINPRVFIAKQIDMTGAKKVAGEWSEKETTERAIKITGDVVSEWISKTHEIFGGPRKTIVFSAGVAHGEDLSMQFAKAGYNFVSISYRDDDEYKQSVLAEFNKPDADIHGVIATDILTKGFDQSDVMIGVSARPFSKSFSSHVQQIGRVMRSHPGKEQALWLCHCIAGGQMVLTHRGLVRIDAILLSDRIWDGHDFVTHRGVVSRGIRPVIRYAGITATPDHLVKTTDEGWRTLGYCAEKQKSIISTGIGRTAVRECDGYSSSNSLAREARWKINACIVRMHEVWVQINGFIAQFTCWENKRVRAVPKAEASPGVAKCSHGSNEVEMQQSEQPTVQRIWGKGDSVQIRFCDFVRSLDKRELRMLRRTQRYGTGSDRQQWELRAWKYPMGSKESEFEQSQGFKVGSVDSPIQAKSSRGALCRCVIKIASKLWSFIRSDNREVSQAKSETEREVWDILDCGPRNSFTCEGLLVHNSGNFLRFREDWDDLYHNGVSELDDGKEKPKAEPEEKEKKEATCPQCKALWPKASDTCSFCGHVRQRRNNVIADAGEMVELGSTKAKPIEEDSETKKRWFQELLGYSRQKGWKDGWAFHKYIERFDKQPKWPKEARVPSSEVIGWVMSKRIAERYNKNVRG